MNRIISTSMVLLTVSSFTFAAPKTPKYRNKQAALFSYVLSYDQTMQEQLNKHITLFEADPKVDPIEKALRNRIYYLFKDRMEKEIGLSFLPIESFQNAINYDEFGFPSDNIGKAIRVGNSKLYYKLEIKVSSSPEIGSGYSAARQKKNSKKEAMAEKVDPNNFKPSISIVITIFNNKGIIPIDKFQGIGNANEVLPTDVTLLDGLVNEEPLEGKNSLMGVANEAVNDLIINMLQK